MHLGMFYFILGNIKPRLRSSLKCIFLFACVKTKHLEMYGFEMVLKPFIEDVNKLSKVSIIPSLQSRYCRSGNFLL